jgi:hypothetical protein
MCIGARITDSANNGGYMKYSIVLICFFLITAVIYAQSVGINSDGSAPDASAMLDVKSTTKGFLPPRVASTDEVTSPATGLLVYQTGATPGYYYYNGTSWIQIGAASEASQWTTNGSNVYYNSGNVGIGTTNPTYKLEVDGSLLANPIKLDALAYLQLQTIGGAEDDIVFGFDANDYLAYERESNYLMYVTSGSEKFRIDSDGNVGIGTTSPSSELDVNGSIECTDFTADYTTTFTIDAGYSSGTWFNVIPTNTLNSYATYIVSIHYIANGSWGPPYFLDASTMIKTSYSNQTGTGNEVILPSASHVPSSSYSIAIRNRMVSGNVSTGIDVQLNGFAPRNGDSISITAKRIF